MTKKRSNFKGPGGKPPAPPQQKKNVIDPKKRIKISAEEVGKSKQFQIQLSGIVAAIGNLRMSFLKQEQSLLERNKITIEEANKFDTMVKKKYAIVGNIVGVDETTNELILE